MSSKPKRLTRLPDGRDRSRPRPSRRRALAIVLGVLVLGYLATGLYSVRTDERAVVQRCGRALDRVRTPDLYFGLPYGIDRVRRLKVLETKRVGVGMTLADRALGRRAEPQAAECLTGDRNLIRVSAIVHYTISDPRAYLFQVADVPALIASVAASELTRLVAGMEVDEVLTEKRDAIRSQAQGAIQAALDRYGAGVRIKEVMLPSDGVAPPPDVADAFADVTSAREDRERAKRVAEGYAKRITAEARGEADRILREAEAYADEVVRKAEGDAARFEKQLAQLPGPQAVPSGSRELTVKRLILETMEDVLPRVRKVILDRNTRGALDLGLIEEPPYPTGRKE